MPEEKLYPVSEIVGDREGQKGTEYLVRWKSYSPSSDTWEPFKNLKNCRHYITRYMEKKKKVRRSTRLQAATANYTESEITTNKKTPKKMSKIHAKKSTKSASKIRVPDKPQSTLVFPVNLPKEPPLTYMLKSMPIIDIDLSSEEELEVSTLPVDTTMNELIKPSTTRLRKKRICTSEIISSTPLMDASHMESVAELEFNNLLIHAPMEHENIREVKAALEEPQLEDTMAQEESETEDEHPGPAPEEESPDSLMSTDNEYSESYPPWMVLGWKEMALASFLTGVGVLGYICYSTDYCSYC